tara:strand:+ start:8613 stop:8873 length:261 start_codon:yes stop_codon:yes gene_type:complete
MLDWKEIFTEVVEEVRECCGRCCPDGYYDEKKFEGTEYECFTEDWIDEVLPDYHPEDYGYCEGGCGKREIWFCSDRNMCKTCELDT